MVKVLTLVAALCLTTAAIAQTPAAPTPAAPTTSAGATDKKAVSKQCSMQADEQKLHGKARKTFRSKCKGMGGKAT